MKRLFALLVVSIAMTGSAFAGGSLNMNPGLWEVTTQAEMQGMTMPPTTTTQCLTEDDAVPRGGNQEQDCEVRDVEVSDDTVTWTMRCRSDQGDVESAGRITYHGESFEGTMTTTISGSGMTIKSTMTGRRVGECK